MAENVMSYANGNASRGVLASGKASFLQSATSPKKAPALATLTDTARSPLVSKSKPKQPYLKRGTGLQNRLVAAKQKRYIPKGGFIKGQTEEEGGQLQNPQAVNAEHITHSTALSSEQNKPHYDDLPRPVFGASRLAGSSSEAGEQDMTSEGKPAPHNHDYGQFAHRHQAHGFGAAQFHANADIEAELDADTALVHFPHQAHTGQGRQAHGNYDKQHFQESCESEDVLQNSMGNLARPHAPVNVPDWQVQQAAEALELEEFRALERQITQDSGSVRGSVASLSSVPAWQRHTSSTAVRKSRGLNHTSQQHQQPPVHAMHHPQSVHSQLSETNELLLEHVQGVRQAAQQRPPPCMTGNPFADPEEGSAYDDDDVDSHHPASMAAQQEPASNKLSSISPVSALPHTYSVSGQQQPSSYPKFEAESAWDASSVAAAPVANGNEGTQDMLQAENASQKYIQQMFRRQQPQPPAEQPSSQPKELETEAIAALEQEMKALKDDRAQVSKLRTQLEQASVRMEQEKAAWKRQQSDETAAWGAEKEAENQRLKRHQRVLDKQSRALLKLPNRKERSEVEAVEAVLEQERKASNAKDARHKLTVERLRQKLVELQDTNAELREEIRFHEQRRLEEWNAKENQQPKAGSRGKADRPKRSEAAASTNRSSKTEQSLEEASSQPVMRPPQGVLQEAPGRRSQMHAPLFDEAQHLTAGGMHPASAADGVQHDGIDEEEDEAIYREDAGPVAEQWQEQSQAAWVQANMAQHEQGARVLPPMSLRHQTEHEWRSSLQAYPGNLHMPESRPSQHASQGMNAFQPIVNMRLPSTSDHDSSSAFPGPQQARQPANTPVDRYQHATVLASPDDFVWQPIRPQTSQQYVDSAAASQPASMVDMSDSHEPTWASHVAPPPQSGHYSRSLRESLDAAACLDSRLQMAQQQKQQQQRSRWAMLDSQWQHKPGQNESVGKDIVGSSASWQNLQEPFAADHVTAPQHAALHKQQPLSNPGGQPQRQAMPLIDRSGPQITVPLPGKQGQYHMPPEASSSADWLPSHAAEADAALEARLYSSQRPSQHDSWIAEAGQRDWNHHAASNGNHGEAQVAEAAAGSAPQRPSQELNYPDGKVEQVFSDGRRSVLFANGTCKQHFPDGHTTIRFTNKDIKRFFHCGRVEYYYCEVDTWHTTHASGIEVFYFPNGQTEAHHPSGTKEIIFPDGIIRRVFTDGREQEVTTEQLSSPVKHLIPEDKD